MASASGIKSGRAYVEIGTDDNPLVRGLAKAQSLLASFGKASASAGGGLLAASGGTLGTLAGLSTFAASYGDELSKASDRTGIAVEALSALRFAAEQSDASLDDLVGGVMRLQRSIAVAAGGGKDPFKTLGLNAAELQAMKPDEAMVAVADALGKISSPTERNAAAMATFGRGVGTLIPLLKDGAGGIGALMAEAKKLNLVISDSDARAMTTFGDEMATVWTELKRIAFSVGAAVGIAVTPYVTAIKNGLGPTVAFVAENRSLAVGVGLAAIGVGALGAALVTAGVLSASAAAAIGLVVTVVGGVVTTVGALFSPLGLAAAALGSIGFYAAQAGIEFIQLDSRGQQLRNSLSDSFSTIKKTATDTLGGVVDALTAGDIRLAGQIGMKGLEVAFLTGKDAILKVWQTLMATILSEWAKAMAKARSDWAGFTNGLAEINFRIFHADDFEKMTRLRNEAMALRDQAQAADKAGNSSEADDLRERAKFKEDSADAIGPQSDLVREQQKIQQAYNARLAEINMAGAEADGQADARQAELNKLLAELAALRDKAAKGAAAAQLPRPENVKPNAFEMPTAPDLSKFTTRVIGGFSADQLRGQTNLIGIVEPLKDIAANTAELVKQGEDEDEESTYG